MNAEMVQQIMTDERINQSEMALRLGVSRQAVSGYLNGSYVPSLKTVKRASEQFGIPIADLIND